MPYGRPGVCAVGCAPTNVSHRNALWDGERLTLINFVNPLCS